MEALFCKLKLITDKSVESPWARYAGTVQDWLARVERLYKKPANEVYLHLKAGGTIKIGNHVYKLGNYTPKRRVYSESVKKF